MGCTWGKVQRAARAAIPYSSLPVGILSSIVDFAAGSPWAAAKRPRTTSATVRRLESRHPGVLRPSVGEARRESGTAELTGRQQCKGCDLSFSTTGPLRVSVVPGL